MDEATNSPTDTCADFLAGVSRAADLFDLVMRNKLDAGGFLKASIREGEPLSLIAAPALRELVNHPEQIDGFAAVLGDWLTSIGQDVPPAEMCGDHYRVLSYDEIVGKPPQAAGFKAEPERSVRTRDSCVVDEAGDPELLGISPAWVPAQAGDVRLHLAWSLPSSRA